MPHKQIMEYMPTVKEYRIKLDELANQWNLLSLLGQMSNIGISMSETREGFNELNEKLLERLCIESLKKLVGQMEAKAQVSVDIVIRNLFERTADIGFLATDDDIRRFITFLAQRDSITAKNDEGAENNWLKQKKEYENQIIDRFNEYVKKYSVYSNIILLDTHGKVLAQLDNQNKIEKSNDPIIKVALNSNDDYVESYKYSDLNPSQERSLTYSFRITKNNDKLSEAIGVLVLVFKFDDEMQGVFENLLDANDPMELLLLDSQGVVIQSSDIYHIPIGAKMQKVCEDEYKIVKFAGREYIAKTCSTKGYQGFFGLGWYGHAMIPLDLAFESKTDQAIAVEATTLESILESSSVFPDDLKTIPFEAEKVQKELDVTVWNGNVQIANTKSSGENSFSKSLLNEISKTGLKTKQIFKDSIANLNQTVISSFLEECSFQAFLAIDIMDRNLYERANDCRWWALTSYFRQILANDEVSNEQKQRAKEILIYINNLYTVYTNLFIYDKNGQIIAVSNENEQHLVGTKLRQNWLDKTLELDSTQKYIVSPFEKTPLYNDAHTYIYNAAIKDGDGKNIGGIGIVFDATPEFEAMLVDALPTHSESIKSFALFATKDKKIIASTDKSFTVGATIDIEDVFFQLTNAQRFSKIIEFQKSYYVVGSAMSAGYREYKQSDDYKNDVVALVFVQIASVQNKIGTKEKKTFDAVTYPQLQQNEPSVEISTFYIQDKLFGLESSSIVCSLTNQNITKIIGVDDNFLGVITYKGKTVSIIDISSMLDIKIEYKKDENYIVLVKTQSGSMFGIVVSLVKDSPEIPLRCIDAINERLSNSGLTKAIIRPENNDERKEMLSILNLDAIYERFHVAPDFSKEKSQR
jgi:chemotaxis signal transduction protein